jgi:RNA polymerase sigma-70 factor (ECF subfamily)
LIENSRNGNKTSYEQLYKVHAGYVHAISLRLLADTDLANENTSKVFLEAWKSMRLVRRDSPFILWLTAITVFSALEKMRAIEKREVNEGGKVSSLKLSPFDIKILSLPEDERVPFVLMEIQHYTMEEITDLLSLSNAEVEDLLSKAKNKLTSTMLANTPGSLVEKLHSLPESIEPEKDLFVPVFDNFTKTSNVRASDGQTLMKSFNEKSAGTRSGEEKTPFSLKNFFRKKK